MLLEISKDVEKILSEIKKARKNKLTPNEQIALRTSKSLLTQKVREKLSIDDVEQLVRNLNFLKQDTLVKARQSIERFLNDLDGKESIYFD
jgi:hypothetical protein